MLSVVYYLCFLTTAVVCAGSTWSWRCEGHAGTIWTQGNLSYCNQQGRVALKVAVWSLFQKAFATPPSPHPAPAGRQRLRRSGRAAWWKGTQSKSICFLFVGFLVFCFKEGVWLFGLFVARQGEPGPHGPPGGPGEDGERVRHSFPYFFFSDLLLQPHRRSALTCEEFYCHLTEKNLNWLQWTLLSRHKPAHTHTHAQKIPSSLLAPTPLSPWYVLISTHLNLSQPCSLAATADATWSPVLLLPRLSVISLTCSLCPSFLHYHSLSVHCSDLRCLSLSLFAQGDDGEIGPRGLPGEPVSDHVHYRHGLTGGRC